MSYQDYENSLDSGSPVELYEFKQGLKIWRYSSSADPIFLLGHVYSPATIERDRIKQSSNIFKDGIKIQLPRVNNFASQFIGYAPEEVTTVTVYRGHLVDPNSEFIVYWKGRVVGAVAKENQIDIECESVFTSIQRPGLRAKFEYGCRHVLYGKNCGVNRNDYRFESSIVSITSGIYVEASGAGSFVDGYFTGGIISATDGIERFIVSHVGNILTINRPVLSFHVSDVIILYPGCDHLRTTCLSKFSNLDNFGGFPWIPSRNPFDGSSIA